MDKSEQAIKQVLSELGIWSADLKETPRRYLAAMREMVSGYQTNPASLLKKTFVVEGSGPVLFTGIRFSSLCEHHLLPFSGTVELEYQPKNRVVGLSKVARLVDCLSRRLQLQERLTREIADTLFFNLSPCWCRVEVAAKHGCVCCRGVRQPGMVVRTSARREECERM